MSQFDTDAILRNHFAPHRQEGRPPAVQLFADMISQWLDPDSGKPYPSAPISTLSDAFVDPVAPQAGIDAAALAQELSDKLLPHTPKLNHPLYLGHMTQALPWMSVVIEAFTAALNQNQVKLETAYASSLVERQTLNWLHQAVYRMDPGYYEEAIRNTDCALGNMVSGGTMGNLTALATALEHALPGVREVGLLQALRQRGLSGLAVLGSSRMHYSLKKAMATLGLGTDSLHLVPVGPDNRIDLATARRRIADLRAANVKLVAIVGVAGATETGTIDPLDDLAGLAREESAWFHVDAAWGGALLLSPRHRALFNGIEHADSVVLDGHKLFFVPMAQGTILFRDRTSLHALRHHANYILRPNAGDLGQTSLEGSRRFDALKLWSMIKLLGTDGYTALFEHLHHTALKMQQLITERDCFELITGAQTFIITYRYIPRAWRKDLDELLQRGDLDGAESLNLQISRLNEAIQTELKTSGESFVSRTRLESTRYPGQVTVLRLVLTNVWTTPHHLAQSLDLQEHIARRLVTSQCFPAN